MDQTARDRFQRVLNLASADPEYLELQRQCEGLDLPVLAAMEKLPQTDRAAVMDYIRAVGASALRLAEIACEQTDQIE